MLCTGLGAGAAEAVGRTRSPRQSAQSKGVAAQGTKLAEEFCKGAGYSHIWGFWQQGLRESGTIFPALKTPKGKEKITTPYVGSALASVSI